VVKVRLTIMPTSSPEASPPESPPAPPFDGGMCQLLTICVSPICLCVLLQVYRNYSCYQYKSRGWRYSGVILDASSRDNDRELRKNLFAILFASVNIAQITRIRSDGITGIVLVRVVLGFEVYI
jgi:hypothetical protein